MLKVRCKDGAEYLGNYHVMMNWPFVKRIFQSSVPCEEVVTRTIDLSEYISYCAMHLIYTCLEAEVDLLINLLQWTRQRDLQDIVNSAAFLGLNDEVALFEPLVKHMADGRLVGSQLRRMFEFMVDACDSLEEASLRVGRPLPDPVVHRSNTHIRVGAPGKKRKNKSRDKATSSEEAAQPRLFWSVNGLLLNLVTADWSAGSAIDAARLVLTRSDGRKVGDGFMPNCPNVAGYLLNQVYDYKGVSATLKTHLILIGSPLSSLAYQSLTFDARVSDLLNQLRHFTSLHVACVEQDLDIVRRLIEPDDVHALCLKADAKMGVIPLHIAAWVDDLPVFVKLMMTTGVLSGTMATETCLIKSEVSGRNVAHYAVMAGSQSGEGDDCCRVLEWLLRNGCVSFDEADSSGKTVLELAMDLGVTRAARLICDAMSAKFLPQLKRDDDEPLEEDNISWHSDDDDAGDNMSDVDMMALSEDEGTDA